MQIASGCSEARPPAALRCRQAFEGICVHANGDVVCSIIDGRGDFPLGNVQTQSLGAILSGPRCSELLSLVLATRDSYCRAIGKPCPLKVEQVRACGSLARGPIRFLEIEPTTACNLRCLACLARDFDTSIGWRDGLRDGGLSFALWDGARRLKHYLADVLRPLAPQGTIAGASRLGRAAAMLRRGSIRPGRTGCLSPETIRRVVAEAGPAVERVHFFGYGEPFLYPHLVAALRHVRSALPAASIVLSTNGMYVEPPVEEALIREHLVDWLVFSIDGADADSYCKYRIRGEFRTAMQNLIRVHAKARETRLHVMWQYVVFRWNDSDATLRGALALAERLEIPIWFDFARSTWGRSRRKARDVEFLTPYLRSDSRLPGC